MQHTGFLDLRGAGATFPWGGRFCGLFSCCTALGYRLPASGVFLSLSVSLSIYIYLFALKALLFNQRPTESHLSSRQQAACKAAWLAAVFLSSNVESQLRLVELSDWLVPRTPPQVCAPVHARAGYPCDRGGPGAQSCLPRRIWGRPYLHFLCTPGLTVLSLPGLPTCVCVQVPLSSQGSEGEVPFAKKDLGQALSASLLLLWPGCLVTIGPAASSPTIRPPPRPSLEADWQPGPPVASPGASWTPSPSTMLGVCICWASG